MTAIGFSSALLVSAFALAVFIVMGAIAWGLTLFLGRIPTAQPKLITGDTTAGVGREAPTLPVTAPRAGLIVQVTVIPGQPVHFAQELFTIDTGRQVLAVRSAREGTAGEIQVEEGDQVEAGQVLMEFVEAGKTNP
jgi:acetyl/propionyl-CoA carboxylase alpha subunit